MAIGRLPALHCDRLFTQEAVRSMKLEMKIKLLLSIASLLAMVFALSKGELWLAVVGALGAFWTLSSYRRRRVFDPPDKAR
jgi:branched-subunit amino acid transport protein